MYRSWKFNESKSSSTEENQPQNITQARIIPIIHKIRFDYIKFIVNTKLITKKDNTIDSQEDNNQEGNNSHTNRCS